MRNLTGEVGELAAKQYYEEQGYTILAQNYRCREGEIDVIASKEDVVVFIEVKARGNRCIAEPREWVDRRKQDKIVLAAMHYISNVLQSEPVMRFDVVEVFYNNENITLNAIEGAFSV